MRKHVKSGKVIPRRDVSYVTYPVCDGTAAPDIEAQAKVGRRVADDKVLLGQRQQILQ